MNNPETLLANLGAPFNPIDVGWRVGATNEEKTKGLALCYVDSRAVMARLDVVCGPWWQCEYVPMPNHTLCCRIGIKIGEEWVWRSNGAINYPDAKQADKPDAKEMAWKGSYSDAFKRAAVLWGIGQYLYDFENPWVAIVAKGGSYGFADGVRAQLDKLLTRSAKAPYQPVVEDREPKAKQTPEGWADAAITIIKECRNRKELDDWIASQGKALDALEDRAPVERNRIQDAIDEKFNILAAG